MNADSSFKGRFDFLTRWNGCDDRDNAYTLDPFYNILGTDREEGESFKKSSEYRVLRVHAQQALRCCGSTVFFCIGERLSVKIVYVYRPPPRKYRNGGGMRDSEGGCPVTRRVDLWSCCGHVHPCARAKSPNSSFGIYAGPDNPDGLEKQEARCFDLHARRSGRPRARCCCFCFVFLHSVGWLVGCAGELPPELGKLSQLEQLLVNSNAFSGEWSKRQCRSPIFRGGTAAAAAPLLGQPFV